MKLKLIYLIAIIYGVVSSTGILKRALPLPFLYAFLALIILYYIFYANKRKIELVYTVIGGIIVNVSVQLTGGINSPLFFTYFVILPVVGYKEQFIHYWIIASCIFGVELLSATFSHEILVLPISALAVEAIVLGIIIKKEQANEAYLKKSLMKYESRDEFFEPADFEHKKIVTSVHDIDRHRGIERPLLFFVKLVHNMFNAYTTAIFSQYSNYLTLIQGFSRSELFQADTVVDLKSGIYRQIISSGKAILIKEFIQNPEELGYYRGEIKIASVMIAPIILLNQVEGILIIDRKEEPFTEDDKVKFTEATKTASLLLGMLRLYEQKSYEAKYLKFIAEHVNELHRELDMKKILAEAAHSFMSVMECNDVAIVSIDDLNETGEVLHSSYIKEHTKFSLDDGLVGFIARHRNYIIKEDLGKGDIVVFKKGIKTKNLSFIGVPVLQDDELLGVVWLEDHRKNKFSEDSANAVNILASQLSFAWQRALLHNQVKELSERDGLTGLYNHRYFQETLQKEIEQKRELVLIMFDIDHFKRVNDTYGHQAGDKVLEFLGRLVSHTGIAARYGGEEFAIILPKYSLKKGIDQAVRIKDHLLKSEIKFNQSKIKITVSIGVAHYPNDALTRDELVEKADKALYRAKETGRDRIVIAKTMAEDTG
jgi:diguanylate cyclase (GGDEF)-like protein